MLTGMEGQPPPRRRWYQFGLVTMFVLVTLAAIGMWQVRHWMHGKVVVNIATARDLTTVDAISTILANNGIKSGGHGSLAYAVTVRRRDAASARAILLDSPSLNANHFKVVFQDWVFGEACPP